MKKDNFITAELYQDMLSLTQSTMLAVQLYEQKFPNVLFDPNRSVMSHSLSFVS